MQQAAHSLHQHVRHILQPDGWGGAAALGAIRFQLTGITQSIDGIRHLLPVFLRLLRAIVHALVPGSFAQRPVEAAGLVIVQLRVAEAVLQVLVLLQPVLQRLELGHRIVQLHAHIGGHAAQGLPFLGLHPAHGPHRCGKAAGGKVAHRKQTVAGVVYRTVNKDCRCQQTIRHRQQSTAAQLFCKRALIPQSGKDQNQGARRCEGQQPHAVLTGEPGEAQPHAGQHQPADALFHRPAAAQRIAAHSGKEQHAQAGEDIIPVDAQSEGCGSRRAEGQQREQGKPALPPAQHRRKGKGAGQRRPTGKQLARRQIRQVQQVAHSQPHRKEHVLGKSKPVVGAQPLAGGDALGRPEHEFIVQRSAAHPHIDCLEAGHQKLDEHHQRHQPPEGAAAHILLQRTAQPFVHGVSPFVTVDVSVISGSSRCPRSGRPACGRKDPPAGSGTSPQWSGSRTCLPDRR